MSQRARRKREIRNIQKSKHSYYVTIPVDVVRELKWKERQKVVVRRIGGKVVIEDWSLETI